MAVYIKKENKRRRGKGVVMKAKLDEYFTVSPQRERKAKYRGRRRRRTSCVNWQGQGLSAYIDA